VARSFIDRPFFLAFLAPLLGALLPQTVTVPPVNDDPAASPAPGISAELAAARAAQIQLLTYELTFSVPSEATQPVAGRETIRFQLADVTRPVVLDFAQPADRVRSTSVNGRPVTPHATNGHLVFPTAALRQGANEIDIDFLAGDASLNRNPDFLYTLFVPARAHLAFPCFDQPDLKARFRLTLDVPATWQVVANSAAQHRQENAERISVRFAETQPLPTYLFAFAAGAFSVETADRGGRGFRMFHRETDAAKVARNRDAIFDLHASALAWLEDYTGIPYPFGKFDFVLVPSFQFGGMEHAGAIFYNAPGLLLDESATQNQKLGRASAIAHETAHMWFGDLVTMRWFDDVWTKEVFANFMAAKIVNPTFPEINHELRFLLNHYPAAYEVDRTAGTNAIRQRLDNLNEAGSLYGAIIYQKAPIVMRQLESIVGEAAFRDGMREYLRRFAFANATWPELIEILDDRTPEDLAAWSKAWVMEEGRPTVRTDLLVRDGRIEHLAFEQNDSLGRGRAWAQQLQVTLGYADGDRTLPLSLRGLVSWLDAAHGLPEPLYVLPNGGGIGYGLFVLDRATADFHIRRLPDIKDPLTRGSAWVTLWDTLLEGGVAPAAFIDLGLRALASESDELNIQRILGYVARAYWRFSSPAERTKVAPRLELSLREGIARSKTTSLKAAYFQTFRDTALSQEGVRWLDDVWRRKETIPGLTFAETDDIAMATELAVREVPASDEILRTQLEKTQNPDRKARLAFVVPSLSADVGVRNRFFASLSDEANRRREPWVLEGLGHLHHPLRAAQAESYIRPSLDLLREIQRTGDIFFPKRWMDATLSGHQSRTAAATVRQFVAELPPGYPDRLRRVILSSADELFRASEAR
jgi:aminopeptidase N